MFSVNQEAVKIIKEKILPNIEQLNCKSCIMSSGATVIDLGVEAVGGWLAGKLFVEATLGGIGYTTFGTTNFGDWSIPSIDVYIDQPQTACLSSQFSSWQMPQKKYSGYEPMAGGPARAIAKKDMFAKLWYYQDKHHEAVLGVQAAELPGEDLVQQISEDCQVRPENIYILVARTGSLAGSIQICSRTVETSIWKLHHVGLDLNWVISGMGSSPVAPPVLDEDIAMDRVNNAIIYGGIVRYVVDCKDEEIAAAIDKMPSNYSASFGERFIDLYLKSGRNIFNMDAGINSVAVYEITNFSTGNTFKAGVLRPDVLKKSFF